jgi:hypothetical protein
LLAQGAGVCVLAVLVGCSPGLDWRDVSLTEVDGLRVRFPCAPDEAEQPLPWPGEEAPRMARVHHCLAGGKTWVVQTVTVDDLAQVPPTLATWQTLLSGNLKQALGGAAAEVATVSEAEEVDVPGMDTDHPAMAHDLAAGPVQAPGEPPDAVPHTWRRVRAWHFAHGHRVFEVAVWSVEDHKPAQTGEDVTRPFFAGLKFPG